MENLTIDKLIYVMGSIIGIAVWRLWPTLERYLSKQKATITLHLTKYELMTILMENSEYTRSIIKKEESILKKQKMDCKTQSRNIESEFTSRFNKLVDERGFERDLKIEFKNAVECVMINMRVLFYEILEQNHFEERENWNQFVNDNEKVFYDFIITKLNEAFPKYITLQGYVDSMHGIEEFTKQSIEIMFNSARETSIKVNAEIRDIKKQQEHIIDNLHEE